MQGIFLMLLTMALYYVCLFSSLNIPMFDGIHFFLSLFHLSLLLHSFSWGCREQSYNLRVPSSIANNPLTELILFLLICPTKHVNQAFTMTSYFLEMYSSFQEFSHLHIIITLYFYFHCEKRRVLLVISNRKSSGFYVIMCS